jgi:hypothetical protein
MAIGTLLTQLKFIGINAGVSILTVARFESIRLGTDQHDDRCSNNQILATCNQKQDQEKQDWDKQGWEAGDQTLI